LRIVDLSGVRWRVVLKARGWRTYKNDVCASLLGRLKRATASEPIPVCIAKDPFTDRVLVVFRYTLAITADTLEDVVYVFGDAEDAWLWFRD
jgi:hypothetical protein